METALARDRIEGASAAFLQFLDAYESNRGVEGDESSRCNAIIHPIHVAAGRVASPTRSSLTKGSRWLDEAEIGGSTRIKLAGFCPDRLRSLQVTRQNQSLPFSEDPQDGAQALSKQQVL
ncbi:hypothetical protein MMC22_003612 [Lobaria immixta]|nr:hypothetical protein [Lobaria immixta]